MPMSSQTYKYHGDWFMVFILPFGWSCGISTKCSYFIYFDIFWNSYLSAPANCVALRSTKANTWATPGVTCVFVDTSDTTCISFFVPFPPRYWNLSLSTVLTTSTVCFSFFPQKTITNVCLFSPPAAQRRKGDVFLYRPCYNTLLLPKSHNYAYKPSTNFRRKMARHNDSLLKSCYTAFKLIVMFNFSTVT